MGDKITAGRHSLSSLLPPPRLSLSLSLSLSRARSKNSRYGCWRDRASISAGRIPRSIGPVAAMPSGRSTPKGRTCPPPGRRCRRRHRGAGPPPPAGGARMAIRRRESDDAVLVRPRRRRRRTRRPRRAWRGARVSPTRHPPPLPLLFLLLLPPTPMIPPLPPRRRSSRRGPPTRVRRGRTRIPSSPSSSSSSSCQRRRFLRWRGPSCCCVSVYRKKVSVLWILWIVRMEVMVRPMHGSSPPTTTRHPNQKSWAHHTHTPHTATQRPHGPNASQPHDVVQTSFKNHAPPARLVFSHPPICDIWSHNPPSP